MEAKAASLLAKLFGNDGRTIPYRPEVAKVVGGIGAAILLQQAVYRANGKNFEPFYKFKEPCSHHLYQKGDSWTEELGFSRREFDNALSVIAVKHTAKVSMEKALETAKEQCKPVVYWTNASRVTFYRVELPILITVLSKAYDQKCENDFSKSAKTTLDQKCDSDFIKAEITTRSPEEKEPASPDSPSDNPNLPLSFLEKRREHIPPVIEQSLSGFGEEADPIEWKIPKPTTPRTAEQHKAGIRRALKAFEQNGPRAGVADPSQAIDPWRDKPVKAWCAFIRLPYAEQSPGRVGMLANDLRAIATAGGMDKTPDDVYQAIKAMAESASCEWLRTASRPTHREFSGVLTNVLCGQVLPEGKRNGGPSTPRRASDVPAVLATDDNLIVLDTEEAMREYYEEHPDMSPMQENRLDSGRATKRRRLVPIRD